LLFDTGTLCLNQYQRFFGVPLRKKEESEGPSSALLHMWGADFFGEPSNQHYSLRENTISQYTIAADRKKWLAHD
jgi:hypothetical protein